MKKLLLGTIFARFGGLLFESKKGRSINYAFSSSSDSPDRGRRSSGLINRFIPMAGSIKSILNAVVVIAVVLWLLSVFGLLSSLSKIHVEGNRLGSALMGKNRRRSILSCPKRVPTERTFLIYPIRAWPDIDDTPR